MQIAKTETLPVDENILIGLSGLPKKRYALQPIESFSTSIGSRLHLFPIVGFFF